MLQDAVQMQNNGDISPDISFWAVENPSLNPPSRAERKVDAGATVLLTQPPFVKSKAEKWFEDVHAMGLSASSSILVGIPMATSPGNLEFWLHLCGLYGRRNGIDIDFPVPRNGQPKEEYEEQVKEWNTKFIRWVRCCCIVVVCVYNC